MTNGWQLGLILLAGVATPVASAQVQTSLLPECPGDPRCPRRSEMPPEPAAAAASPAPGSSDDFAATAVSDTVYFAADRVDLSAEAAAILDSQIAWLLRHPAVTVTLEGHTDDRRSREASIPVAERRAIAVRDYLVLHGVDPARIMTVSYGKERPVALGDDAASRARNRRVVTAISP